MGQTEYFKLKGLENAYLEDSYVLAIALGINESKRSLQFDLLLVLTEDHPQYEPPKENEQYCYCKAKLVFADIRSFEWLDCRIQRSVDANDEVDFGNIDVFYAEGDEYHLNGDWGQLRITSKEPELVVKT